jgi:hypothetical protein
MVFGVCTIGIVAAVMRFQSFLAVNNFNDITCENVKPLCWMIAERGICFVAGCMLGLKPLVKRIGKETGLQRYIDRNGRSSSSRGFGRLGARDGHVASMRDDYRGPLDAGAQQLRLVKTGSPQTHPAADS